MAATSIFFNGRLIRVPGAYTEVDASGLEVVGLGANGIVALLGESIGGKPWNSITSQVDVKGQLQVATSAQKVNTFFRSGDLKEAGAFAFGPSNDPDVPGGAVEVVFIKTNPATQSAAAFSNVAGEALLLTSEDWGFFTTQINVQIATGTLKGKLITIVFETITETFDDVGGDTIFTLVYLSGTPADGFTTITAEITASAINCAFTRDQIGLDNEVTAVVVPTQIIELLSSSAADTAVMVRLYGTDTGDATQVETVLLTGTGVVTTLSSWNEFHGAEIVAGTLVGTLTIQNLAAASTITTIAPAGTEAAIEFTVDTPATGIVTLVADAATTKRATVFGLNAAGVFQTEVFLLAGAVPVPGTATWSRIDGLAYGNVEAARTVTASGNAVVANFSGLETIQKLADFFNGKPGFTLTVVVPNPTTFLGVNLDKQVATSILSPTVLTVTADLQAIIDTLNNESGLVTAAKGAVASGPPDNTVAPVFLAGGNEGSAAPGQEGVPTSLTADWQGAHDLLKKVFINTLVPLTSDPAIHAITKAHCEFMGGIGRSERDAIVGIENAGQTDVATKTEIKAAILALNTRHLRVCAQAIERFDTLGSREEFAAPYQAVIGAGMQAGSPVGTSMTHKIGNVLKVRQDASWNPFDDSEELIAAGLFFMETVDGIGRRWKRNITSNIASNNLAFTEASVNEAVNFSVFNFRTNMEFFVGKPGFAGTVAAAQGVAVNTLGLLIDVSLVAWRSLDIQLVLDVLEVSVEIAPVLPINFVQATIHLVSVPQSAAA